MPAVAASSSVARTSLIVHRLRTRTDDECYRSRTQWRVIVGKWSASILFLWFFCHAHRPHTHLHPEFEVIFEIYETLRV